ncbi:MULTISPECIES: ABC transporter permease [Microbacterium]|jgi:ABC-type nitrate/sulfonate/bicarbonate transport system permease component|uniref:ABC transporter permease n=1 Tax=Microbacterium TaxID=33882 RepID=UPI0010F75ACA|nr:ABC transporter permease subunit [Microbacterium sp. 4NA327F11]MCK9919593.1 ABC transporter permease subunit [Microbacteriaceae bacterium K1510]
MTTAVAASESATDLTRTLRAQARRSVLRALLWSVVNFVGTIVAVIVLWAGALSLLNVSKFVAKGPLDVWNYLFVVPAAATNRDKIFATIGETLAHSVVGFIAGLLVALVGAMIFQLSKGAEHALMPIAMLLRSVPLVAMAPVIILIFGREVWSIAVIGGIVVLFPALVNISFGLKSAAPQMNDLVTVYGGGSFARLMKVAMPSSLPAFFAAVRISVPGAITGALLAEWLAVGGGVGGSIGGYLSQAQYNAVWASIAGVTAIALVLYNVIQIIENVVLARMGMQGQRGV